MARGQACQDPQAQDPLLRGRQRERIPAGRGRGSKAVAVVPRLWLRGSQRERSRSRSGSAIVAEPHSLHTGGAKVEFFWADWFRTLEEAPNQVGGKSEFKRGQWCGKLVFAELEII